MCVCGTGVRHVIYTYTHSHLSSADSAFCVSGHAFFGRHTYLFMPYVGCDNRYSTASMLLHDLSLRPTGNRAEGNCKCLH